MCTSRALKLTNSQIGLAIAVKYAYSVRACVHVGISWLLCWAIARWLMQADNEWAAPGHALTGMDLGAGGI
eukprot:1157633-Pelagomonas_calceolata.AAC.1